MKKNIAAIIACTMLLSACSSDDSEETTTQTAVPETTIQETETEATTAETTEETTVETIEETTEETEIAEDIKIYVNCELDDYELPEEVTAEGSVYVSAVDISYHIESNIRQTAPDFELDDSIYWVEILEIDWDNGTAKEYIDADLFHETAYNYYYDNLDAIVEAGGYTLAAGAAEEGMTEDEYRDSIADMISSDLYNSFWHDVISSTSIEVNDDNLIIHWEGNAMGIYEYEGDDLSVQINASSIIYPDGASYRLFELYE